MESKNKISANFGRDSSYDNQMDVSKVVGVTKEDMISVSSKKAFHDEKLLNLPNIEEASRRISLNNIKLIKELGYGFFSKVYLVKNLKNLNEYAMKIQKIPEKHIKINRKIKQWNEIYFSLDFANKYPDQFIYLYDYIITKNCIYKPFYINKKKNFEFKKNLINSKYCILLFYSLIDGTLDNIIDLLSKKQYYSLLIQISYIFYLLTQNNYFHTDIHFENFGYIKTNKIYIKIFNYNIPTYGYIFKIIDYGNVNNKNNLSNIKNINELRTFITRFIQNKKFINYLNENKIHINYKDKLILFKNISEYKLISKLVNNIDDKFILYEILFPESYQNFIIGKEFNTIYQKLKIDLIDLFYIMKSNYNPEKIIDYFYMKIKEMNKQK
jgi:hypothetical protein